MEFFGVRSSGYFKGPEKSIKVVTLNRFFVSKVATLITLPDVRKRGLLFWPLPKKSDGEIANIKKKWLKFKILFKTEYAKIDHKIDKWNKTWTNS